MRVVRTEGRYASTVSQIILGATVVAPVARPQDFRLWVFLSGIAAAAVLFGIAYYLAGKEVRP